LTTAYLRWQGYCRLGTRIFSLADSVSAVSVRQIRSGRFIWAVWVWAVSVWWHFGLGRFSLGTFQSGPFQSADLSVKLWNLSEVLHVRILIQKYLNQQEVLFE